MTQPHPSTSGYLNRFWWVWGQLWGCSWSGDSMLSGGNGTWLMTPVVAKQRSVKYAENTSTKLSPGHCCSSSLWPLAGFPLHFFLFFLRTILQKLVQFSPMHLSLFPSLEVPIPLGGHQPTLPSLLLGACQGQAPGEHPQSFLPYFFPHYFHPACIASPTMISDHPVWGWF